MRTLRLIILPTSSKMLALPGPLFTRESLLVGGVSLRLEAVSFTQDSTVTGTGGTFWDASYILCQYLEAHPDLVQNKLVLELGSGLGLGAMGAKLLGARSVVATDLPEVLPAIQRNCEINQVLVETRALDWLAPEPLACELIIMADVVWVEPLARPLASTLHTLLTADNQALLVNKPRSNPVFAAFTAALDGISLAYQESLQGHDVYLLSLS